MYTKLLIFVFLLLPSFNARASKEKNIVKIAILDTGFNIAKLPVCDDQPKGYTQGAPAHGNNIAFIINDRLPKGSFCFYLLPIFDQTSNLIVSEYRRALEDIERLKPDFVNMSFTGRGQLLFEVYLLHSIIKMGVKVIAAAGNDGIFLSHESGCSYYPACTHRDIIVVGMQNNIISNFGPAVDAVEYANQIEAGGYTMTGTSQAAALHTAKLAKKALQVK